MRNTIMFPLAVSLVLLFASGAAAQRTDAEIAETQAEIEAAGLGWTAGRTSQTELTREQFRARLIPIDEYRQYQGAFEGGASTPIGPREAPPWMPPPDPEASVFNWRDFEGEDWTTPPGDQGLCGSCSTFAASGPVEGSLNVAYGYADLDYDLSEQKLLSCTSISCDEGGSQRRALRDIRDNGVPDEACYPYMAEDGNCNDVCEDMEDRLIFIDGYAYATSDPPQQGDWGSGSPPTDEEMKAALMFGPLATSMMVWSDFDMYTGGVYEVGPSATESGGHALTIIGWNDDNDSWYGKNSWGTYWGDDGYFEIKRGDVSGFGGTDSQYVQLTAEGDISAFGITESSLTAFLTLDEGLTEVETTTVFRSVGDGEVSFYLQMPDDAPWLTVEPLEGTVDGETDVELTVTFDEAEFTGNSSGTYTREVYLVGGGGLSRLLVTQLNISYPPGGDSDADSDTDSDADSDGDADADADGDADAEGADDAGAESGDSSGCACGAAGGRSFGSILLSLVRLLVI